MVRVQQRYLEKSQTKLLQEVYFFPQHSQDSSKPIFNPETSNLDSLVGISFFNQSLIQGPSEERFG